MQNSLPLPPSGKARFPIPWKAVIRFLFTLLFMLAVLFLAAGSLTWWAAWAYTGMTFLTLIISRALLILKHPDTARERSEAGRQENVKAWDQILMPLTALVGPLFSWIIAGLDYRFGWSPDLPDPVQAAALGVILAGGMIGTWAMLANSFFSSHVRIQTERGHQVISAGPYRWVRHPGYASGILSWIVAPFYFSSYWVAIPTVLVIAAMVLRTALEDRVLREELPGYREYTRQVCYRLLPGVW